MREGSFAGQGTAERTTLKLEDVDSFVQNMGQLLYELEEKIGQLPGVDKNGFSECPFAEELYAYAEEAAAKVVEESKKLKAYLELVKEEIRRCKKNIDGLSADKAALHIDEAKRNYEAAKESQKRHYNKAIHQQELIIELIKRTEELLRLSKTKKWPVGKPRRQNRFNPEAALETALQKRRYGPFVREQYNSSGFARPSLTTEMGNLLSLGPVRKGPFG